MWVHKVLEVSVTGRVAAKFKIKNVFSPYNKNNWYKDDVIRRFSQRLLAQLVHGANNTNVRFDGGSISPSALHNTLMILGAVF